jgi:predicted Zn-dependent protease
LWNDNTQLAKSALAEALKLAPELGEARLALAGLYLQSKSFDLAIEESNKVLGLQPKQVRAHLLLGRAYLGKREPAKASAAFKAVTENAPQDPMGYYYLGLAYRFQKQDDGALTTF